MNHSRLVCIAPGKLETGPQRMKISILGNHQHESRGLCGKPEWFSFLAKWDSKLLLSEPGQMLGNSGQEKLFFRELHSFETRLVFFLSNSKSTCSCVHYRLDQQLLLHYITVWARWKWVIITRNWEQRKTAVCNGLMWLTAVDRSSSALP